MYDILVFDDGCVFVVGEFGIEVFENVFEFVLLCGDEDDEEMFGWFRSFAIRAFVKILFRFFVGVVLGEVMVIRFDCECRFRFR